MQVYIVDWDSNDDGGSLSVITTSVDDAIAQATSQLPEDAIIWRILCVGRYECKTLLNLWTD